MNQTAIVFGGSGFVGSHVCEELKNRGFKVTVADLQEPEFDVDRYFLCDVTQFDQANDAISNGFDYVFNFAGVANIDEAMHHPVEAIQSHVMGNLHVLESCRAHQVKRYIYGSSAYVFSDKASFYGISKRTCEDLILEYQKRFGIPFTIVRYGSLYGEKCNQWNGVYRILKQALKEKTIVHEGDGEEIREFIHCRDAAKLTVDLLDNEYENRCIMLTGIEKFRMKDWYAMVQEIMGDTVTVKYLRQEREGHFKVTPYVFRPRPGEKLVNNPYIDMGQGVIEVLSRIYSELGQESDQLQ